MYLQLNAEFQRRARRDKKAFFNIQCIKIEKNNREQRTRGLFRKTGNIKRTCCSKSEVTQLCPTLCDPMDCYVCIKIGKFIGQLAICMFLGKVSFT